MSKSSESTDYSGIIFLIMIGGGIVFSLPFNLYINILIIAVIILLLFFILIAYGIMGFLTACKGLAIQGEALEWGWNYWESMKKRRWDELTEEDKDNIVKAYSIISLDCRGYNLPDDEIREEVKRLLPYEDFFLKN